MMIVTKTMLAKAKKDSYKIGDGIWSTRRYGGLFCDSQSAVVYYCMRDAYLLKPDDFVRAHADAVKRDIKILEGTK